MAESGRDMRNGQAPGTGNRARPRSAMIEQSRELVTRASEAVATSRARVDDAERRVRRVLDLLLTSQRTLNVGHSVRAHLRDAIESYAHLVAAEGVSPEQMLVRLKTSVHDAEDAMSMALDRDEAKHPMEDVVRWSVDAYYAA